jgi:SNF2 family DNA or RNA helicase
MLKLLQRLCDFRGHNAVQLTGATLPKERLAMCERFNNPSKTDTFVMLLSMGAGAVGLNLTGANRVVLFEPSWNPASEKQAQDRAYRIGQVGAMSLPSLSSSSSSSSLYVCFWFCRSLPACATKHSLFAHPFISFPFFQKRDVEVYRLISAGTVEMQKYLRQVYKSQMAESVLNPGRFNYARFC